MVAKKGAYSEPCLAGQTVDQRAVKKAVHLDGCLVAQKVVRWVVHSVVS